MTAAREIQPHIRRAGKLDIPLISQLAASIWRDCYPGIITNAQIEYMLARMYSLETLQDEMHAQQIHYELLFAETDAVGFASYGPAKQTGVFKLHKLYLRLDWRGRGLGSMLLQYCEREALKLGARKLVLNVNKRNLKAIRAYGRNGFRIEDSVVADIGGGFVMDDFVMGKELT